MTQVRNLIEGWPALMSTEMAARYLTIEEEKLIDLASQFDAQVVELDSGAVRWRRQDLDRLIKRLPLVSNRRPAPRPASLVRLDPTQLEALAEAVALRLERKVPVADRKLVSIREAGSFLGIGRSTIYRMINDGELVTRRIGRRTLIQMESVQAILQGSPYQENGQ